MTAFLKIVPAVPLLALLASGPADAVQRTFVSGIGSDAWPCSLTQPCRSFTTALGLTDAGGEIIVLDSAGYGAVTINKSVSITAPQGIYAGVSVFSGAGITVSAGPTGIVSLRNLTITGLGGMNGIVVMAVERLYVEDVKISGFTTYGIQFITGGDARLFVTRSSFRENWIGIEVAPPGGSTTTAVIDEATMVGNAAGFRSSGPGAVNASISRSNASGNDQNGIIHGSAAGGVLSVDNSTMSGNLSRGLIVNSANGTVVISGNTAVSNDIGVEVFSGTVETRQNNTIRRNTTNVVGATTPFGGL